MYVTGADILTHNGVKDASQDETTWADLCAGAVNSAIDTRLNGAVIADPSPAMDELRVAALIAGGEAFKRKEAAFGLTGYADLQGAAIRVSRDYLQAVYPQVDRYGNGPGIG
jgi:hypothetical protein